MRSMIRAQVMTTNSKLSPWPVAKVRWRPAFERAVRLARFRMRPPFGSRGVTLVEVLIVVAIMAMLAGGVAFYALPRFRDTQITSARSWALEIRRAVHSWQQINNEVTCPTMSQLKQDKIIDAATETTDPWKEPFILTCSEDEVYVTSKGPDKKQGSPDDITVPGAISEEEE